MILWVGGLVLAVAVCGGAFYVRRRRGGFVRMDLPVTTPRDKIHEMTKRRHESNDPHVVALGTMMADVWAQIQDHEARLQSLEDDSGEQWKKAQ